MALQPALFDDLGTIQGVHARISDLVRRVNTLEATRGSITSLSGGVLAPGTVPGTALVVGSITADHIAAGSITADHIQAGSISATHIQANAINAGHIQAGQINAGHISANSISATHIQADAITATHIAANQISAGHIQAGTITATQIAANTITAAKIAAGTITAVEIAANTITAGQIASGTITSSLIAAGTITATNIAAGTITGALMASDTITGDKIVTGAITASKISVSNLAAVSTQTGTLTVDKIRTASSGARIEYGTGIVTTEGTFTGLAGIDASNAITFLIDAATGAAEFKGTIKSGSTGLGNIAGSINGGTQINPDSITGDRLVIDAITAREIAAATITATEIAALTITGGNIAAGTITGAKVAAGTITADLLTIAPGGNNLIRNSTFGDGVGVGFGWTSGNMSSLTTAASSQVLTRNGPKLMVMTADGTGVPFVSNNTTFTADGTTAITNKAPVIAGEKVIAQCWAGRSGATARSGQVRVLFYDESDVNIAGGGYGPAVPLVQAGASRLISGPWTVPAGATRARFLFYPCGSATTPAAGEVFYMNGPKLEVGDVATEFLPYVDPTTIDGSGITTPRITAGTVTGALVQTAATNARVALDGATNALRTYNTSSSEIVRLDGTGGLRFLEGDAVTRRIEWRDNNIDGTAIGWVNSYHPLGFPTEVISQLTAKATSETGTSRFYIRRIPSGATDSNQIAKIDLYDGAGTTLREATIMRGDGASSFVQFGAGATPRRCVIGTITLNFAAGATASNTVNVTPPAPNSGVVYALATVNTWYGAPLSVVADPNGTLVAFNAFTTTAHGASTNYTVTYLIAYNA